MLLPFMINKNAAFEGSDNGAKGMIEKENPDYKPWAKPFFEPSKEIETLIFSLQAALGTGVICYYLGYAKGKKKHADH
jgi:cobalt/nickel transport protein